MGRPRRSKSGRAGESLRTVENGTTSWTETDLPGLSAMGRLPDGFDQGFPDFGPLLPFDPTLHSVSMWPDLPDPQHQTLNPTSMPFDDGSDVVLPPESPTWPPVPQSKQMAPAPAKKCACVEMVHQHFSLTDDNDHSFTKTLSHLQSSTVSASKILDCSTCFDPKNSLYGLSKNIHLLGSLMSSIASTYAGFLAYQRKVAMEASRKNKRTPVRIGQDGGVLFQLSGEEYWTLLKTTIGSEIDHLMDLCTSFADRQIKTHSRGHEVCESGKPCHKEEDEEEGQEIVEEENCPSNIDIAKSYSCFRTVEQVRAAIYEAKRIVEGEGWGEVVGQQCL